MSEEKPKVLLILEQSEDNITQVGIVKDCHGSMPVNRSKCDIVGTWSRFGEGTFYVELTTPVEALQDILIQLIAERVKSGELATYPHGYYEDVPEQGVRRQRTVRAGPVPEVPSAEFSNLRAKLGR